MTKYRTKAYVILLITTLIWGAAGPVIKFTLNNLDPLTFLTYRFSISAMVAVFCIFLFKTPFPKKPNDRILLGTYAVLTSTIVLGLLFYGLEKTTVLNLTLINTIGPLLIALAGVKYLNEHITKREKKGISIAFIGILITVISPLLASKVQTNELTGNMLVVLFLIANTVSVVLAKKLLRRGMSPLILINTSFIAGFLTITPIALLVNGPHTLLSQITLSPLSAHAGVWYMAILSGNLAYFFWVKAQKTIEVGEAALFAYLGPLISTPLAVFWLKESINTHFIIGAIFIGIGVFIAETKSKRKIASGIQP